MSEERAVLVDASVFITLAEIGHSNLLRAVRGQPEMPAAVVDEISDDPAASVLSEARNTWVLTHATRGFSMTKEHDTAVSEAASHLSVDDPQSNWDGDVALLTHALVARKTNRDVVVITDDKLLRKTCKALAIPVSGSIGVLVNAVERGELETEEAKAAVEAMDEVGARLSVGLMRRAERQIDEAASKQSDE